MSVHELREFDEVRTILYQGLWLQRALPPSVESVRAALEWAQTIVTGGHPLPPIGFVADLGNVLFSLDWEARERRQAMRPNVAPTLLAAYEDHVLGRLYADSTVLAAGELLRSYRQPRERSRGLAFVLGRFQERAGFDGIVFSPAVIHTCLERPPDEVLRHGLDSLQKVGLHPTLVAMYESLLAACRRTSEVLDRDDLLALQHGIALDDEGEQIAYRQVLRAATMLESSLPLQRVRPLARQEEVPTRVLDEDTYPVGGFSSLSNRGSVESLLHSQLAYIDDDDRPDLFEIKYLRDELLYYSRDENAFFRRRRKYVIALLDDLAECIRFKDAELPYQRGILLLAVLVVAIRKVCQWLSADALQFEIVFSTPRGRQRSLALQAEFELLLKLLRESVNNQTVVFHFVVAEAAGNHKEIAERLREKVPEKSLRFSAGTMAQALTRLCMNHARRSACHCLLVSTGDHANATEDAEMAQLRVDGPCPALISQGSAASPHEVHAGFEGWTIVLQELLRRWL